MGEIEGKQGGKTSAITSVFCVYMHSYFLEKEEEIGHKGRKGVDLSNKWTVCFSQLLLSPGRSN